MMGINLVAHEMCRIQLFRFLRVMDKRAYQQNMPVSSPSMAAVAPKLPGAASLHEHLDTAVLVCLRDGRVFLGHLRSFDQYANLVLDRTMERLFRDGRYAHVAIGLFVIRGENVMLLGQVDGERLRRVDADLERVDPEQLRGEPLDGWPIPEEM